MVYRGQAVPRGRFSAHPLTREWHKRIPGVRSIAKRRSSLQLLHERTKALDLLRQSFILNEYRHEASFGLVTFSPQTVTTGLAATAG